MAELRAVPSGDESPEGTDPSTRLASLLRQSSWGDESAFALLYDAVAPRLYGLVVRVLRDPAQSEEVTQEVFLEIWRMSSRFDPDRGSALGWMMTIAHRKAVDRVRSAAAAGRREHHYHEANQDVDYDSTAEAAQASLEAERVRKALQTLTRAQRPSSSPSSVATRTPRWRRCSTYPWGPPRHASATASSGCVTPGSELMNSHDAADIHALSGAYAVDAVDDIERAEFERHLATCADCREEVASFRATATHSTLMSETPPERLREQVMRDIAKVRPLPPAVGEEAGRRIEATSRERAAAQVPEPPSRASRLSDARRRRNRWLGLRPLPSSPSAAALPSRSPSPGSRRRRCRRTSPPRSSRRRTRSATRRPCPTAAH